MTNIVKIENKISAVRKYLDILGGYQQYSQEQIVSDLNLRGAVERYLYLVAQATIDLGEVVIAHKKFRKPTAIREVFDILQENGIITGELTEKLISMAGFRNVMAHDYENVDYRIVYRVLHQGLDDIREFLTAVEGLI